MGKRCVRDDREYEGKMEGKLKKGDEKQEEDVAERGGGRVVD